MDTASGPVFVLIGAGSTVFTPGLLHDLAASAVFTDADVRLVDIAHEAADTMAALGRRIAAAAGSRMRVTAVPDRRQALAGQDFADPDEIACATQVAAAQLNARARPWIWRRPQPKYRSYRRRFVYLL